jgi:hypothetical protein
MRLMGLVAIYQRPNTSTAAAAHKVYPYLLGGIAIERVNQVWCSDVTYIPMAKGFLYLVVIMDWVSRAVLAWRLSNTLGADFCVEALEEALARYGRPEIFNTDQGSQFTSDDFTGHPEAPRDHDQHGWQGPLHGQHLRRAAVAQPQIRGSLPPRLCQAAVSVEPSQGSLDNPAPGKQLKAGRVGGALDDLNGPIAEFGEGLAQVGAVVDAVGEEMAQPG